MNRRLPAMLALSGALALPAATEAQAPGYQGPDARTIRAEYRAEVIGQVNRTMEAWGAAYSGDDIDSLMELYVEGAVIFPPEGEAIRGLEAIRAWFVETLPGQGTAEAFLRDFEATGSMAMAHSNYRIELREPGRTGGEASGDLITVHLQRGRVWKIRTQVFRRH